MGNMQSRVTIDPLPDSWTNVGKREKGCCRHWPRCKRGEQECLYFHGYGPFDEPDDKAKKRQSERKDFVYDIRCLPRRDVREGCLYLTARCRRHYDKDLRYVATGKVFMTIRTRECGSNWRKTFVKLLLL
jgi:hypothetical protein